MTHPKMALWKPLHFLGWNVSWRGSNPFVDNSKVCYNIPRFFFFPHFKLWEAIVVKMSLCGTHCTSCDAGGLRCVLEEHTQVPVGSQWAWKEEDFSIKLQQDFSTFVQETQGENSVSNINAPLFSLRRSMLSIVLFPVNLSNVSSHRFAG